MPNLTIGELKRASLYMAGQLASAVAITGGTISAKLSDVLVETGSTTANLNSGGVSLLGSTVGTTYTIGAPNAGVYKYIRNTTTFSNVVYTGSTDISVAPSSTLTRITMASQSALVLKGETATRWGIYGTYNSTLISLSS